MDLVTVANLALLEVGNRVQISSLNDQTPQAQAANLFLIPKIQMIMRAAPWDSLRAQIALSQYKAVVINGVAQTTNLPPQPWNVEYLWPSDCLKARFLVPTYTLNTTTPPLTTSPNAYFPYPPTPTNIPFVPATDRDANNSPIKVILTNLYNAQLIYNRDLSSVPDLWDSLLLSAVTATLGAYFINALARNAQQMGEQIGIAKGALDQARAANANEGITNADHVPDWMQTRQMSAAPWALAQYGSTGAFNAGWLGSCEFPSGLTY